MKPAPDSLDAEVPAPGGARHPSPLPSVEQLLSDARSAPLIAQYGRSQTLDTLRTLLAEARARWGARAQPGSEPEIDIYGELAERLAQRAQSPIRRVYNLTGTVLHTNLGRALLPHSAIESVVAALGTPINLEFDLERGERGERDTLVESLLCELTGAEAATVVNNNAAAVLLMLGALAPQREVVVSRGELVEIGGAFRIPDVMVQAGAQLREVGTTNRTHLADYENALGEHSALLMKVHCSNYALQGFTKSVDIAALSALGRARDLPTVADLGSGTLIDLAQYGLPREPTVRETIAAGADLVTFSGDKLLGGPQAGLIVGRADLIRKIKRHPLKRALRVGKLTLAALEPVLALYRAPEFLAEKLTTLRLLTRPAAQMQAQAQAIAPTLGRVLGPEYRVEVEPVMSQIGSGALPVDLLPSYGLVVHALARRSGQALNHLEARLRALPQPVLGRISKDALRLDLRCLEIEQQAGFVAQLERLCQSSSAIEAGATRGGEPPVRP